MFPRCIFDAQVSRVVRKPAFCICENKDADQLRGNRYTDNTIPLLSKSDISSLWPSSVAVQPGLCQTWSETLKTGFLTMINKSNLTLPFPASNIDLKDQNDIALHCGT